LSLLRGYTGIPEVDTATTVLFMPYPSTSGTWGSTLYLAAIAEGCRRAGDRVVFHACEPTAGHLEARGFEVARFAGTPPAHASRPVDSFYDVCAALGFDDPTGWDRLLADEIEVVEAYRPAVLVSDMRFSAPVLAARSGVPLVSLAAWSTDPRVQARGDDPLDEMARTLAARWSDLRISSLPELVSWHADVQVATSTSSFEPVLTDIPGVVFTGYLRDRVPGRIGSSPAVPDRLVVVYASSAPWGVRRVVESLSRAAEALDAHVWCVLRAGGVAASVSSRCQLFDYLPFDDVLPRARALVFHGGQGSALASLHHGVPSLVVPGRHYERAYNAGRIADLRAGVHGAIEDFLPSRLVSVLGRVLDDDGVRRGVDAARDEVRRLAGPVAAVEAIHALAG
jgi:UDP:flavonoid glycosyltransferase YjiC (YdhE family)